MPSLEEVHKRLANNKAERRDLQKMFKDDLKNTPKYVAITEELKTLRDEKKTIENELKQAYASENERLEQLKADIADDQELLSDIALNMYVNEETVEIKDDDDNVWHPEFKVTFKRN